MTSLIDVQTAIHTKLTNDASLMALVEGVFDDVEDNQKFPYVVIGEATELPFNTFTRDGKESTLTIHIWSRYEGFKEALQILKQLNAVLDDTNLSLSEHSLVSIQFDDAQTIRDDDGKTRHVPATYRVHVQED